MPVRKTIPEKMVFILSLSLVQDGFRYLKSQTDIMQCINAQPGEVFGCLGELCNFATSILKFTTFLQASYALRFA